MLKVSALCVLMACFALPFSVQAASSCAEPACYAAPSSKGAYLVTMTPSKTPIAVNQSFDMDVQVSKPSGEPLGFAVELKFDSGMPHHGHGMNVTPTVTAGESGKFKVSGLVWHMPGKWTSTAEVVRGVMRETASTEIEVK